MGIYTPALLSSWYHGAIHSYHASGAAVYKHAVCTLQQGTRCGRYPHAEDEHLPQPWLHTTWYATHCITAWYVRVRLHLQDTVCSSQYHSILRVCFSAFTRYAECHSIIRVRLSASTRHGTLLTASHKDACISMNTRILHTCIRTCNAKQRSHNGGCMTTRVVL